jgi:hypothetical protein|tara:strand:- start:339 stop:509 length:171 start_codon:yes stop_codon:yes gene_type:complete
LKCGAQAAMVKDLDVAKHLVLCQQTDHMQLSMLILLLDVNTEYVLLEQAVLLVAVA